MSHGNLKEKAKNYCFELIRSTNIPVLLIIPQTWRCLFSLVLFGQNKKKKKNLSAVMGSTLWLALIQFYLWVSHNRLVSFQNAKNNLRFSGMSCWTNFTGTDEWAQRSVLFRTSKHTDEELRVSVLGSTVSGSKPKKKAPRELWLLFEQSQSHSAISEGRKTSSTACLRRGKTL